MNRLLSSSLAIAAFAGVTPTPAVAASLVIDDTALGETITFNLNDFEGGFFLDGVLVQQGLNNPASVTVAETNAAGAPITHTFSADWIIGTGFTPRSGTIAFAEGAACCSDVLTFLYSFGQFENGGHLAGTFVSDVEGSLLGLPQGATVVQEGAPFVFNNANITASAISDIDVVVVPEPATLALLGLGLAGIAASRRRKDAS